MTPPPRFRRITALGVKLVLLLLLMLLLMNAVLSQPVGEKLPGYPGKLPFRLETGYIGVGKSEEVQLFYYFIKSERNPQNDPLMLWLTGGPGCSAFSGLVFEIGPFTFDFANSSGSIPTLVPNPYSWTKVANIIFLDQPAGSGFSYAKTPEAYNTNDTLEGAHVYEFLKKWLINHPKYLKNPLYIAGDSYSGIIVPLAVNEVYNGIKAGSKPLLNFKGYILGNPITDVYVDVNERVPYAYRMGLLSDSLYKSAEKHCHGYYLSADKQNALCKDDLRRVNQCLDKISLTYILEAWCDFIKKEKRNLSALHMPLYEESPAQCRQDDHLVFSSKWANDKSVREALHIREGTKTEWIRCNSSIIYQFGNSQSASYTYNVKSTLNYHKSFTKEDCRALIYSGDHDMVVPHSATEQWINSLPLRVKSDWRPWFVGGQISGYTMKYARKNYELTYATVKGAGHTAPEFKRLECLVMIDKWFNHTSL